MSTTGNMMYKNAPKIYTRISAALNKSGASGLPEDKLREIHDRLSWVQPDDLVAPFMERVEQSGGDAFLCNSKNEIIECLSGLIQKNGITSAALEDSDIFSNLGIIEIFQSAGCNSTIMSDFPRNERTPELIKDTLAQTDAGITTVTAGFADCGAVLSEPGPRKARMLSELTNVHIALLRKSDIYPSMSEYASTLAEQLAAGKASARTIIGGPSKTADIEKTLVQGVHGPRVFAVIVVDDSLFTASA